MRARANRLERAAVVVGEADVALKLPRQRAFLRGAGVAAQALREGTGEVRGRH